jgi:cytochrome c peroxidase
LIRPFRRWFAVVLALATVTGLTACATLDDEAAQALLVRAKAMFGTVAPVQLAEIQTPVATLGRALFWDPRLSVDGKTACASCHAAADWSADRRPQSVTARGDLTTLHSQSMFMAQDQLSLRWYGDRRNGAHQAERSVVGSMGFGKVDDMVAALRQFGYEDAFKQAFPTATEAISVGHYGTALEAYQRTLRTPAPFDDYLNGRLSALSPQQQVGLQKFNELGCIGCHRGPLLGGESLQKFGLVKDYWLATGSKTIDKGRFNFTKKDEDLYVYRVPMLRNIARTGPYFHDGSVATLEQAVKVMADVQLGRSLPAQDVADIVAFLDSLTGDVPQHYAAPASWPAARPVAQASNPRVAP